MLAAPFLSLANLEATGIRTRGRTFDLARDERALQGAAQPARGVACAHPAAGLGSLTESSAAGDGLVAFRPAALHLDRSRLVAMRRR